MRDRRYMAQAVSVFDALSEKGSHHKMTISKCSEAK